MLHWHNLVSEIQHRWHQSFQYRIRIHVGRNITRGYIVMPIARDKIIRTKIKFAIRYLAKFSNLLG